METGALKCCLDMSIQPGTREGCLIISRHVKRNITKQSREWRMALLERGGFSLDQTYNSRAADGGAEWRETRQHYLAVLDIKPTFSLLLFRELVRVWCLWCYSQPGCLFSGVVFFFAVVLSLSLYLLGILVCWLLLCSSSPSSVSHLVVGSPSGLS